MNNIRIIGLLCNRIRDVVAKIRRARRVSENLGYDALRFRRFSGSLHCEDEFACRERIIMAYHVLEKGLTMPKRRLGFGRDAVLSVINLIVAFEKRYTRDDNQVLHAADCVCAYFQLHFEAGFDMTRDAEFWDAVKEFCKGRGGGSVTYRILSRETFFAGSDGDFLHFAKSRHSVRHYCGEVCMSAIYDAVRLAMTAPSACNRQYVRVHCISDHAMRDKILSFQNGNRGFGLYADKLLAVTSDLRGLRWDEERNDIYINGGIFLLNLVYSLHYYKIGSCILNWSVNPAQDKGARKLLGIPDQETIIALIACGQVPDQLMIAESPRKKIDEVFQIH